tara:strand:+ start:2598 stop:4592 length:1995 start_codon:yes stop_codon:yes gene_type:complete
MKKVICTIIVLLSVLYSYSQTYTVDNGTLVCTGTGITSDGIYDALISNGIGSGHFRETLAGNKKTYVFNAPIRIGNDANSGSSSVWNCSNQHIKINAASFQIYGSVLQGNITGGQSADGGSFSVVGTANDSFRLFSNGIFRAYGSALYAQNRIRVDNNCEFKTIDCDFQPEDGVSLSDGWASSNSTISYDRTRVHHTTAVGIKLYAANNTNTFSLNATKVEGCKYAFQLGNGNNLTPILKDVEINSCEFHIVPNQGNANIVFVNPDFTTLRANSADANDITTIAFRYTAKVLDAANLPIENASCYYIDGNSNIVLNNKFTDAAGNITGLVNYDGETCLQNSTYAGNTKTDRQNHIKSFASYLHNLKSEPFVVNKDISENIILSNDILITEPSKAITNAYTEIETTAKFYDRAKAFLVDNYKGETATIITKNDNTIDAKGHNVIIDATAATPFAFDGSTITIKANVYTGNIITSTSATITTKNGALLEGGYSDSSGINKFVHLDWNDNTQLEVSFVNNDDDSLITSTGASPTTKVYKGFFLLPTPAPTNGVSVEISFSTAGGSPLYESIIPLKDLSFINLKVLLDNRGTEENQLEMLYLYKKLLVKTEAIKNSLSITNNTNVSLTETITNTNSAASATLENQEALIRLLKRLLSKITANRESLKN